MVFGIISVVCVLLFLGTMLATHLIIKARFKRGSYPKFTVADYYYEHYQKDYPRTALSFYSGKNRLQGYVYGAENNLGLMVFAHGIGTGHESYIQEILWMVDHGWRVFAYDATGSCESEGKGTIGLVQSALDLHAALTYVEADPKLNQLPVVLMGHSWGGYAVTAVLNFDHPIKGVVSFAGYADPTEMMMDFALHTMGKFTVFLRPFVALENKRLFGMHASLNAVDGINRNNIPVMIVHGTCDRVIPIETVAIIAHRNRITNPYVKPKIMSKEGQNDHNDIFTDSQSLEYMKEVAEKYQALQRQYQNRIPNGVRAEFWNSVDRDLINTANQGLMNEVHAFLWDCISK